MMDKKKYSTQYQFIKIIKKTDSTTTYLANKNFISFKNIIRQIDLSKIFSKKNVGQQLLQNFLIK